jgi:hypothetical protein
MYDGFVPEIVQDDRKVFGIPVYKITTSPFDGIWFYW